MEDHLFHDADMTLRLTELEQEGIRPLRLGVIGCGYVAVNSHLPASKFLKSINIVALVDVELDKARMLAEAYDVQMFTSEYDQIFDEVDGVVIAVPHHLHAPIAQEFLDRGIHVLVEKPLAVNIAECMQLVSLAQKREATLAVGHVRRFYDSSRLVKILIDSNTFGSVRSFHAEEAVLFDKFNASGFTVLPPTGGVLLDTGPHTLDLLLWWLGDFNEIGYWDDRVEGVEANCRIKVTNSLGLSGIVELSRTRELENKITIMCEDGEIEYMTSDPTQITIRSSSFSGPLSVSNVVYQAKQNRLLPYFAAQINDFALAINRNQEPFVTGDEAMRSIAVIDHCRKNRQPLDTQPWERLYKTILPGVSN